MSNRRRPNQRRRYGAIAATAAVLLGGGTAAAVAATSGGGSATGSSASGSSGAHGLAVGDPQPLGSDSASASASTSGTAAADGGASTGASASTSAGASASASSSTGPVRAATNGPGGATTARSAPLPVHAPVVFTGRAFDACTAPTLATMTAWHKSSPYGGAAVYIGGRNRGCAQPQLTNSWVHSVSASGWKLIPLYVGAQPPCQTSGNPERITAANAASLGATDGADAAAKASALGMGAGSAIYLDMEDYDIGNTSCVASVLSYVQAWDRAAHTKGYWAGFYGFSKSSAAALATAKGRGTVDLPDALWYARYDNNANTTTGFPFATSLWTGHRRGHQYAVNFKETFGGASLTVDHDAWDGPVALVG